MRDIKFRIYFKDEEPFMTEPISLEDLLHEDWIEFENKEGTLSLPLKDFRFFYSKNENYEIMQYTGLKDRNMKEIYSGDIIEFSYDMFVGNFDTFVAKGKVVFEEGAFYVEVFENERTTKDEAYLLYSINLDTIEVIGNIYDNPELLEKGE